LLWALQASMSSLQHKLVLASGWIMASSTVETVSLDELSTSLQVDAMLERVFPLRASAISWEDVPWRSYSKIIISGPQRSGSTFFAAALAQHLGYVHADELARFNLTSSRSGSHLIPVTGDIPFTSLLDIKENVVFQRPRWSHKIHKLWNGITSTEHLQLASKVFVAFMARNCLDVYRSQNRIIQVEPYDTGWTCKYGRTVEWKQYHSDPELAAAIEDEHDMICTIKQQAYRNFQRPVMNRTGIPNAPIAYSSLHSLASFTESGDRSHLAPKQLPGG
jgi:hypothetical protein